MKNLDGFIAVCNRGYLGVITGYDYQERIYFGYSIEKNNCGNRWESSTPHIVDSIIGLKTKGKNSEKPFTKKGVIL